MWKSIAIAVCFGLLGAGVAFAFAANDKPAPPAEGKAAKEDWLPKPGADPLRDKMKPPPTAFPELAVIQPDWNDPKVFEKREEEFARLCPHFAGKATIKIEATDDTLRKLLKAQLHQAIVESRRWREIVRVGTWETAFLSPSPMIRCLADIQSAATELWSGQPKELIPWLEECVVMAKAQEPHFLIRVVNGTDPPQVLNYVRRHRLKAEAELWKAKNPK